MPLFVPPALPLRQQLIRSQAIYLRGSASTNSNITVSYCWALECEFDLVRLVFHTDQGSSWTLNAAAIAPSAKLNNGYDPVDAADGAVSFTAVTFHAAGADGLAPSPTGAATSLTIPASASTDTNAYAFSDWMRCSSLARADAGDGRPLLMVRAHATTAMRRAGPLLAEMDGAWLATENKGRIMRGFFKSAGNFTTSGFTSPTANNALIVPSGIQYYARRRGGTVICVGDSLTQGQVDSTGDPYAWGHYATAILSTRNRPVSYVNGGWSSATSANFLTHGRTLCATFRPDVVALSVWTPNDTRTQAAADIAWQNVMEVAAYVVSLGAVPVLATAVPYGLTLADDNIRKTINARARAMGDAGAMLVADLDAAVSDGGSPAVTMAPYKAASNNHLSIAGYTRCGEVAAPVIGRALLSLGIS